MSGHGPVGCIADDITGATDIASAMAARGLRTRLAFGTTGVRADDADVVVVALKIRSVPAEEARRAAGEAAAVLRRLGAGHLFSKYCSTFDSTSAGNIGPIADVLADAVEAPRVVHGPAYPANGRTVYLGHLFVGDELLSESPMRDHPLNPMRDSRLTRVLAEQTDRPVALLPWGVVSDGTGATERHLERVAAGAGEPHHVIADVVRDEDLDVVAQAVAGDRVAGGSAAFGAAYALAVQHGAGGRTRSDSARASVPPGPAAIVAGSLSRATTGQVRAFAGPTVMLGVDELLDGGRAVRRALDFADERSGDEPVLISTDPTTRQVGDVDRAELSQRIEQTMGRIGLGLVERGVRRLVVAGGETSGAVADALGLRSGRIGPDISTGVPWVVADDRELAVAFKSGNFGGPTFFSDALAAADA